jgi:hypothetical protein
MYHGSTSHRSALRMSKHDLHRAALAGVFGVFWFTRLCLHFTGVFFWSWWVFFFFSHRIAYTTHHMGVLFLHFCFACIFSVWHTALGGVLSIYTQYCEEGRGVVQIAPCDNCSRRSIEGEWWLFIAYNLRTREKVYIGTLFDSHLFTIAIFSASA